MEWLKKALEGLNVTDAQFVAIEQGVKDNYKDFIPKHRFDDVNEAKKQLENDLKERDQQLNALKDSAVSSEELKAKIEQIQAENQKQAEEYQAKLKDLTISSAIKLAVATDVHDSDLVSSLLDKSKIEIDEHGAIKAGLDEQIHQLRESKGFLFVDKNSNGPSFKGINPKDGSHPASDPVPQNLAEAIAQHYSK